MRTCCLCKHTSRQCYTFQPHVSQDTFFKKKKEKNPHWISPRTFRLACGPCCSECQRLNVNVSTHLAAAECWISRNSRWREEERLRRPVPEISHEGMFLHVCANDWPWHACVAVVRRRTVTEECCLWLCLFGLERHRRHSIVLVSEDLSCIPEQEGGDNFFSPWIREQHKFFTKFCEAH